MQSREAVGNQRQIFRVVARPLCENKSIKTFLFPETDFSEPREYFFEHSHNVHWEDAEISRSV